MSLTPRPERKTERRISYRPNRRKWRYWKLMAPAIAREIVRGGLALRTPLAVIALSVALAIMTLAHVDNILYHSTNLKKHTGGGGGGGPFVDVYPGDDLDDKINTTASNTTIRVHGDGSSLYVYSVDHVLAMKAGQTVVGDTGTTSTLDGRAQVPVPSVGVAGTPTTTQTTMFRMDADNVSVKWLDLDATRTQKVVNGLAGGYGVLFQYDVIHGAPAAAIGQYRGKVSDSELYGNGTDATNFDGTVSAIKCNYQCEVARNYVHDNPGNGIWCDVGCLTESDPPTPTGTTVPSRTVISTHGFWIHDNVSINNSRHGIFYENSPRPCTGTPVNNPCNPNDTDVHAEIYNNRVAGNGLSGISTADSLRAHIYNNILGKAVDGSTLHNQTSHGIETHSSNVVTRGTQGDALIEDNVLNGEIIWGSGTGNGGCGSLGNVCQNNTP